MEVMVPGSEEYAVFHYAKLGLPQRVILLSCPQPKKLWEIMQQENGEIVSARGGFVGGDSARLLARRIAGSRACRAFAALALSFLGVVTAFGIAPDTVTEPLKQTPVVVELALPAANPADVPVEGYWREERIQRRDTLAAVLERLGAHDPEAAQHPRNHGAARARHPLVSGHAGAALSEPFSPLWPRLLAVPVGPGPGPITPCPGLGCVARRPLPGPVTRLRETGGPRRRPAAPAGGGR